jgi:CheY-like chemotaxis protein
MGTLDGTTLLIAEDESAGAVYCASARQEGANAFHAKTVKEALDLLSERSFDAAWIDLGMPNLDQSEGVLHTARLGSAIIQKIREYKDPTFIVVMTGNRDPETTRDFLVEGSVNDYLTKRTLTEKGYGFVWNLISDGIKKVNPASNGSYGDTAIARLFGESNDTFLFNKISTSLGKGFTHQKFKAVVSFLARKILPLRQVEWINGARKESGSPIYLDYSSDLVVGYAWSGRLGGAVEIRITSSDGANGNGDFMKVGDFIVSVSLIASGIRR